MLALIGCNTTQPAGLPKRFVPLDEWPRHGEIIEQAREVCRLKMYPDGSYGPDLKGPYVLLCERWRAVEAYGEGINAWRGEGPWWKLWEQ